MVTRSALLGILGLAFVFVGAAAFLLLRDPPEAGRPPDAPTATHGEEIADVRLAGVGETAAAGGEPDFTTAGGAVTLGAFRFQPPNVPAGAVARLRHLVEADPELLEHLVRVALKEETLRAELVPPDYPYEARQAAAWAIEALGRPTARILAARLETETDPRMRRAIYWVLGRLGAEAAPAVEALVGRMRDTGLAARERGKAIHVLGAVGGEAQAAVPDLLALLRDPDDDTFGYALNVIYPVAGMTDAVRDAFVELLAIEDSDLRVEVLQVVVDQMGEDAAALRPSLVALVEHGGPDVRRTALWALRPVGLRARPVISLVGRRVEEGDEDEETAATALLLASGEPGHAELLAVAGRTEFLGLSLRIADALQRGDASVEAGAGIMIRLLRDSDADLLNDVVYLLVDRPTGLPAADYLPLLRAELRDPGGDRRWAAALLLSNVVGADDRVIRLLQEALDDAGVAKMAMSALGRMVRQAERVVPLLEARIAGGSRDAVNALGALAVESAVAREALHGLTAAQDPEVRDFARRVLAEVDAARAGR